MNLKKLSFLPIIAIGMSPIAFVVSCGSSSTSNPVLPETQTFQNLLNDNKNLISAKSGVEINNFLSFTNWRNVDDLVSESFLGSFFTIADDFKSLITQQKIYGKIKRFVVQPTPGSKSLTIIFYLGSALSDQNIVSLEVQDALASNFEYKNVITITDLSSYDVDVYTDILDADGKVKESARAQFINDCNKISKDPSILNTLLKKAFNMSSGDISKVINNIKYFSITKNSSCQLTLSINSSGLSEGFMFKFEQADILPYGDQITSNPLVK